MNEIDLTKVKLLPLDHIALKDYEFAVGVEKKNKMLEKTIFSVIAAGVVILIYFVIKDETDKHKQS
jgi:hypothetical protein